MLYILSHLGSILISLPDDSRQFSVLGLKIEHFFLKSLLFDEAFALVFAHLRIRQEGSLLLHLVHTIGAIKCFVTVGAKLCQLDLDLVELLVEVVERSFSLLVLFANILEFLTSVRHDDDRDSDLPCKFAEFFVTLFNLFIESLVLNLELLKIDQVKTVSKLLLLLENFLAICKLIFQLNVLESILMNFRVLGFVSCFPVVDHSMTQRLVCS